MLDVDSSQPRLETREARHFALWTVPLGSGRVCADLPLFGVHTCPINACEWSNRIDSCQLLFYNSSLPVSLAMNLSAEV